MYPRINTNPNRKPLRPGRGRQFRVHPRRPASCPVRARYRHWRNVAAAAGRQTSVSWSITLQTLMSGRASRTATAAAAAAGAGGSAAA